MTIVAAGHPIRVARPTRRLADAERFWVRGVGLDVLWRSGCGAEGGHALLMVGLPGAGWHLELVEDGDALAAHPPGPEDLLVVYRGEAISDSQLQRILEAGGRHVIARNPYWERFGTTIQDPDGHLLVLSHRAWG